MEEEYVVVEGLVRRGRRKRDRLNLRTDAWSIALEQRAFGPRRLMVAFASADGDVRSVADAARMIDETGCHGIALGRGALANPWVFRQFDRWVRTGDPGPRATYHERLDFMRLHLRRLIDWRGGEKYGCVQFRKVATWYTKALRLPKRTQAAMVMLENLSQFEELVAPFAADPPAGWSEYDAQQAHVAVPAGPISHW